MLKSEQIREEFLGRLKEYDADGVVFCHYCNKAIQYDSLIYGKQPELSGYHDDVSVRAEIDTDAKDGFYYPVCRECKLNLSIRALLSDYSLKQQKDVIWDIMADLRKKVS